MIVLDRQAAIDKLNDVAKRERARRMVKALMSRREISMAHAVAIKRVADTCDLEVEIVRLIVRDEREQRAFRAVL